MTVTINLDRKIIRKKIQGMIIPEDEEGTLFVETIWIGENLESIRLYRDETYYLEISESDIPSLFKSLDQIFLEGQSITNEDITIEWVIKADANTELHISAQKESEDSPITFQVWLDEPDEEKIAITEQSFKDMIDFLTSFARPVQEQPGKMEMIQQQQPPSEKTTEIQKPVGDKIKDRIAELKAQFYRDIEMIAKELEKESLASDHETSNQEMPLDKIDQVSRDTKKLITEYTETTDEFTSTNMDDTAPILRDDELSEFSSEELPEEWIDSLETLLHDEDLEQDDDHVTTVHPTTMMMKETDVAPVRVGEDETSEIKVDDDTSLILEGRDDMISDVPQEEPQEPLENHVNLTRENIEETPVDQQLDKDDDEISSSHTTPGHETEKDDLKFVSESLLEKELEEFFGKFQQKKLRERGNDSIT